MADRSATPGGDVHRLLDEAFAGVPPTPEAQDLKEEVRANLLARVADLEASGVPAAQAARDAVAELGDVRALLADEDLEGAGPEGARPTVPGSAADAHRRHRVRPRPAFVVRTVLLALVAAGAATAFAVGALGGDVPTRPILVALATVVAVALGVLTADALAQETTTNHPLPARRAAAFGAATASGVLAPALGAVAALQPAAWLVATAALLLVAALASFGWLGATVTNRHKAWTRGVTGSEPPTRFEREPEAAARFGIYSLVIWTLALAAAVVLGVTAGWWWSPLGLVAGFVAMMLTLARMLFAGTRR